MDDISEVWKKVQVKILHNHPKIVGATARASHIIRTLLMLFSFNPNLVDPNFRSHFSFLDTRYMDFYRNAIGEKETISIEKSKGSYFDPALGKDPTIESSKYEYRMPLQNIILAKDYVVSLTDGQAIQIFNSYSQGLP